MASIDKEAEEAALFVRDFDDEWWLIEEWLLRFFSGCVFALALHIFTREHNSFTHDDYKVYCEHFNNITCTRIKNNTIFLDVVYW